jgi:hypothetical protein
MPLTPLQIELAELDEATLRDVRQVHAFLKANSRLAYSADEVAEAVDQPADLVAHMLEKFDDVDLVETRTLGAKQYYRYLADLPDLD